METSTQAICSRICQRYGFSLRLKPANRENRPKDLYGVNVGGFGKT